MFKTMAILGVLALTAGCASVMNEGSQAIAVNAVCKGMSMPAQCVAENAKGQWTFVAPKQIVVLRDRSPIKLTCKPAFMAPQTVLVRPGVDAVMAGNVLLGGLVGGAVDLATARGWQYPSQVDVEYPSCN